MSTSNPSQSPRVDAGRSAHDSPRLLVLARPTLDQAAIQTFLDDEGLAWRRTPTATDPENLVEVAGRVCYLSFGRQQSDKTNAEYISHLVREQHESVLEHATWSFILSGISRGFSHQLVRHRVGFSFSQLSQQYHDETEAPLVMPRAIREIPSASEKWHAAAEKSLDTYRELIGELEEIQTDLPPREQLRLLRTAARSVLPAATETKLVFSANGRALRHFLQVRGTIEGDEEMRLVSALLARIMQEEAPALFADFRVEHLSDGLPVVRQSSASH
jgi:thymidylate synthase (FAD)